MAKIKAIAAFALISLCLVAFSLVHLRLTKAQYQGNIIINADGSVTPSYAPIIQLGNNYTLASNLNGSITINRNNITLDGNKNNYFLQVPSVFSAGITLNGTSDCIVTNFYITGGQYGINIHGTHNAVTKNIVLLVDNGIYSLDEPTGGIMLAGSSNIISGNAIGQCKVGLNFVGGLPNVNCTNNLIVANTFTDCSATLLFYDASNNTFYHNIFIADTSLVTDSGLFQYPQVISINYWDNGYPSGGNYWSDYRTKYSRAQEIDNSGIGNTPYIINGNNSDHYPLWQAYIKPATSPSPSLNPTVPELPSLTVLTLLSASFLATIVFILRRRKLQSISAPFEVLMQ